MITIIDEHDSFVVTSATGEKHPGMHVGIIGTEAGSSDTQLVMVGSDGYILPWHAVRELWLNL
jgi:hypothetical protein